MTRHGSRDRKSRYSDGMMSRIGITTLLAIGALMGSSGVAVGASALSTDTTSSAAQYGQSGKNETLSGSSGPAAPPGGGGGTAPAEQSLKGQTAPATAAVQAPRQLEASQAQQLPFTGYGLIPILLIGMLLLAGGLVLRRRTLSPQAQAQA